MTPDLNKQTNKQTNKNPIYIYIPVLNQPCLSKLLEKVVLRSHLLANNLFETFQCACRAHYSAETALLDVSNCLLGNADEGRVLTLIDLSVCSILNDDNDKCVVLV